MAAGGVFLVPWLPSMLYQSAHTGTPWASVVRPTTMVTETLQDVGGGDFAEGVLLGWALFGLFLLGLLATRLDDVRLVLDLRTVPQVRREAAVVGLTVAIAARAGFLTRTTFATRYAAVIFPLFLIVAAVGLTRLDMPIVRPVAVSASAPPRPHRRPAQRGHGPHAGREHRRRHAAGVEARRSGRDLPGPTRPLGAPSVTGIDRASDLSHVRIAPTESTGATTNNGTPPLILRRSRVVSSIAPPPRPLIPCGSSRAGATRRSKGSARR